MSLYPYTDEELCDLVLDHLSHCFSVPMVAEGHRDIDPYEEMFYLISFDCKTHMYKITYVVNKERDYSVFYIMAIDREDRQAHSRHIALAKYREPIVALLEDMTGKMIVQ